MHVTIAILVIAVCVALALSWVLVAMRITRPRDEGETSREAMKRVRKELQEKVHGRHKH